MRDDEKQVLSQALKTLDSVEVDFWKSGRSFDFQAIGKMLLVKRMLAEITQGDINSYLLPGESAFSPEEGDDFSDWCRLTGGPSQEPMTEQEKRFLLEDVLPMLHGIGGINDSDDACLRCAKRMLSEVAGDPQLPRLLMEKEVKPLYFPAYQPLPPTPGKTVNPAEA